ncbi:hypothetical protein ABBQ38_011378 [Trebouxia sp. C0009 RCD-2024]
MAQALVTKAVQENLVMVFSKSYCPHCVRAKRILDAELGPSKYVIMELENRSDCPAIQDYLRQLTGARTVPRVFLKGTCIGGGAETAQLQKSGKLKQLLHQIGAV